MRTKIIELPKWWRMSPEERSEELRKFAETTQGSGARCVRCETWFEFLHRIMPS